MEEWYYNEHRQVGIDFSSEEEVKIYDEKFKTSRNFDSEAELIIKAAGLNKSSSVLEIGSGTGELTLRLAKHCKKVTACDISDTMLSYTDKKICQSGLNNVNFVNAGFLYDKFQTDSFDAVISQLTLHHLPDFWKSVAINNIYGILKEGGVFYLMDSILSFDMDIFKSAINGTILYARGKISDKVANEIIINIRDEYPTFNWIIEGMLRRNGFSIDRKIRYTDFISVYISSKQEQ